MLFDAAALAAALAAAAWAAGLSGRSLLSARLTVGQALLAPGFLLLCHRICRHCGLYSSHRVGPRRDLYARIARAVSLATLVLAAGSAIAVPGAGLRFLIPFWVCGLAVLAASRWALYWSLQALRARGRNLRNVLVVGAGPRAMRFAAELESRVELGYCVVGFLDEEPWARLPGARRLGGFDDLAGILRADPIDEVAVALPIKTYYSTVARIIALCEQHGVVVRLPADLFQARTARTESEQVDGLSVLTLFTGRGSPLELLVKRAADFTLAFAALALLWPLMAAIAIAVRLDSPGPIFFQQVRLGHNRRRFRMWKFRTMTVDAESRQAALEASNEVRGAAFKLRADPRVTRRGRRLRRLSLDELPQLLNVLKGDMSLVGPRPLPLRDVERLTEDWQRRRFSVRPGLTCLWQSGGRHRLDFDEWMRLDLDYIDNWSLLLDLKILARTLPAVWTGAGAS